ncbi:hypothetical protein EDEG_02799 [Edhazardia aedis USNM 41457]|uniref:Uncharacterized protein n=1 Tax=Edhazardia aedis (strain USNM 41457) TaxID=1003232 RepID=J8ZT07_EDHAE|nr:hypothetical protein EDEG_02799 [Edhazardia aedis USNM 41457]|eukprot:EJW02803.1 hypothetical protein EDEG_02799 [Edhazardia aedis USNM 41457]
MSSTTQKLRKHIKRLTLMQQPVYSKPTKTSVLKVKLSLLNKLKNLSSFSADDFVTEDFDNFFEEVCQNLLENCKKTGFVFQIIEAYGFFHSVYDSCDEMYDFSSKKNINDSVNDELPNQNNTNLNTDCKKTTSDLNKKSNSMPTETPFRNIFIKMLLKELKSSMQTKFFINYLTLLTELFVIKKIIDIDSFTILIKKIFAKCDDTEIVNYLVYLSEIYADSNIIFDKNSLPDNIENESLLDKKLFYNGEGCKFKSLIVDFLKKEYSENFVECYKKVLENIGNTDENTQKPDFVKVIEEEPFEFLFYTDYLQESNDKNSKKAEKNADQINKNLVEEDSFSNTETYSYLMQNLKKSNYQHFIIKYVMELSANLPFLKLFVKFIRENNLEASFFKTIILNISNISIIPLVAKITVLLDQKQFILDIEKAVEAKFQNQTEKTKQSKNLCSKNKLNESTGFNLQENQRKSGKESNCAADIDKTLPFLLLLAEFSKFNKYSKLKIMKKIVWLLKNREIKALCSLLDSTSRMFLSDVDSNFLMRKVLFKVREVCGDLMEEEKIEVVACLNRTMRRKMSLRTDFDAFFGWLVCREKICCNFDFLSKNCDEDMDMKKNNSINIKNKDEILNKNGSIAQINNFNNNSKINIVTRPDKEIENYSILSNKINIDTKTSKMTKETNTYGSHLLNKNILSIIILKPWIIEDKMFLSQLCTCFGIDDFAIKITTQNIFLMIYDHSKDKSCEYAIFLSALLQTKLDRLCRTLQNTQDSNKNRNYFGKDNIKNFNNVQTKYEDYLKNIFNMVLKTETSTSHKVYILINLLSHIENKSLFTAELDIIVENCPDWELKVAYMNFCASNGITRESLVTSDLKIDL